MNVKSVKCNTCYITAHVHTGHKDYDARVLTLLRANGWVSFCKWRRSFLICEDCERKRKDVIKKNKGRPMRVLKARADDLKFFSQLLFFPTLLIFAIYIMATADKDYDATMKAREEARINKQSTVEYLRKQ